MMRLKNQCSGKYTRITDADAGEFDSRDDALKSAANRLITREYGSDCFAHRAVGWSNLPNEFEVRVCRAVGDMTEDVKTVTMVCEE